MRHSILTIALAALLISPVANAAGGKEGGTKEGGSKSESAPAAGGSAGLASTGGTSGDFRDLSDTGAATEKAWDVGAGFEYHHLLTANDLNATRNKNVNYWSLSGRYDITPDDRISILAGLYQYFISDQGESGARLDDLLISYSHRFGLPGGVNLRLTPAVALPTSYGSQLAGVYAEPRLGLGVDKRFFKYLNVEARLLGRVFIVKGAEGGAQFVDAGLSGFSQDPQGGANPNPKGGISGRLTAELAMPFHDALSISLSGYTAYTWLYNVGGSMVDGGSSGQCASAFGQAAGCMLQTMSQSGQPALQTYAYEITARYVFPSLKGFKTDLSFTFAPLGDSVLGTTSVNHADGSRAIYGYYRQTAEIYAGLNAHY